MPKAIALSLFLAGTLSAGTIEDAMKTETRESLALNGSKGRSGSSALGEQASGITHMCSRCGQPFLFPEDRSPKEGGNRPSGGVPRTRP